MMRALVAALALTILLAGCLASEEDPADDPVPSVGDEGTSSSTGTGTPDAMPADVLDRFEDAILRKLAETDPA
jgi:ABC-type glycerol-3-phosphate transport system substrate-binding protein